MSEPRVLVESAAGTIVVCGFGRDEDFGNGIANTAAGGPYCLGIVDGTATWLMAFGQSIAPSGSLIDDTLWITTATAIEDSNSLNLFEGKLIGLDPDSGAIVAYASHRIDGAAIPWSAPRVMVGEGRCAGVRGVGVTMSNTNYNGDTMGFERVIAGADGTACVEPVASLQTHDLQGAYYLEWALVEPSPGPCEERPHLVLMPPGDMCIRDGSGVDAGCIPAARSHGPMLMTVRANDCAMGIEATTTVTP